MTVLPQLENRFSQLRSTATSTGMAPSAFDSRPSPRSDVTRSSALVCLYADTRRLDRPSPDLPVAPNRKVPAAAAPHSTHKVLNMTPTARITSIRGRLDVSVRSIPKSAADIFGHLRDKYLQMAGFQRSRVPRAAASNP
jgi:hypothetical protein